MRSDSASGGVHRYSTCRVCGASFSRALSASAFAGYKPHYSCRVCNDRSNMQRERHWQRTPRNAVISSRLCCTSACCRVHRGAGFNPLTQRQCQRRVHFARPVLVLLCPCGAGCKPHVQHQRQWQSTAPVRRPLPARDFAATSSFYCCCEHQKTLRPSTVRKLLFRQQRGADHVPSVERFGAVR